MPKRVLALLLILVGFSAVACGGSKGPTRTETTTALAPRTNVGSLSEEAHPQVTAKAPVPRRSHTERTEHNKQSRTNANVNTTKEASKHEQREEASKHRLQEEAAKKREEEAAARRAQEEAADKRQEEVKARKTQEEATKSREQARKRQETKEAEEKKTASAPSPAAISAGKRLFDATCTSCHGMHGEGSTLAPAYGAELPRSESITGVIEQLTRPLNQKGCKCMPTYDAQYSSTEKEELADYVTTELTHTVKK